MAKKAVEKYSFSFWFKKMQLGVLALFAFILFIFLLVRIGVFGFLPDIESIKNPQNEVGSVVYTEDFEILGSYFIKYRIEVPYQELPKDLVNGLIATEDKRFFKHSGIDGMGLVRVFFKTFLLRQDAGGGSTISQQTAKNLFYDADYSSKWARGKQKLKEWYIAVQLERNFSKEEIIALYFNTVWYNYNAFGIKAASQTYFNKSPKKLSTDECALLVGMLKGPSLYNPNRRAELCIQRRNTVLMLMKDQGFITDAEKIKFQAKPIQLNFRRAGHDQGAGTYFRAVLRNDIQQLLKKERKTNGEAYDIDRDGLVIYTSINYKMQLYAEEAALEHLKFLQKSFAKEWKNQEPWKYGAKANPKLIDNAIKKTWKYQQLDDEGLSENAIERQLKEKYEMTVYSPNGDIDTNMSIIDSLKYAKQMIQCALLAVDPHSGYVKAWVGGPDFRFFQLDHVKQTKRQVGSTIKPLLYTVALDNGMLPCDRVPYDCPEIPGYENWCPRGTGKWETGSMVSLVDGLANSDNLITSQLMKIYGPQSLIDMAKVLNIDAKMERAPAICLGTSDISLLEMVGAYTAFANNGIYCKPVYIKRIEDKNGNVIAEYFPERKHCLSSVIAQTMTKMLTQVVERGTAARIRSSYKMKQAIAGKTGTTQSNSDAWFMGYTPELLAGVWVGCDDPSVTFKSSSLGQGASAALPIWAKFMSKVYADKSLKYNYGASFSMGDSTQTTYSIYCEEVIVPDSSNAHNGLTLDDE